METQEKPMLLIKNKLQRNNLTLNLNSDVSSKLTITSYLNLSNTTSIRTQNGNQLSNPVFRSFIYTTQL